MLVNEMVLFYYVVRFKSFSQAAEKCNVSKAYVSKHIAQLEQELQTKLLFRNTRQLSLTEAGEIFYAQCEKLFALAQQGYDNMAQLRHQPTGTLKISVPPALAMYVLTKPLAEYQQRYPDVTLNVVLESQLVDLVQQGYDLALRSSATLPDSSLIARKLTSLRYMLCATPQYLKKHGALDHPEQLAHHRIAVYSTSNAMQQLEFIRGNRQFPINVEGKFQSNQIDLIAKMVMASTCAAVLPEFMVADAIKQGKLTVCLPKYRLPAKPLYLLYPQREFVPLKVKAFIDLLKAEFAKI